MDKLCRCCGMEVPIHTFITEEYGCCEQCTYDKDCIGCVDVECIFNETV